MTKYSHQISFISLIFYAVLSVITLVATLLGYDNAFQLEFLFESLILTLPWYFLQFTRFREISALGGWFLVVMQLIMVVLAAYNCLPFTILDNNKELQFVILLTVVQYYAVAGIAFIDFKITFLMGNLLSPLSHIHLG